MPETLSEPSENRAFSLEELCVLASLSPRTVRYYIQLGLVERPEGETRAAKYFQRHLDQLLTVKKWVGAGMALESIRALMASESEPPLPQVPRQPGTVEVWSHLHLADGVELTIEPGRAGLTPEQVRELLRHTLGVLDQIRKEKKK